MKFLEASRLIQSAAPKLRTNLLIASSAMLENLEIYLKAEFIKKDTACEVQYLPFNTLTQYLVSPSNGTEMQVIILFPWDFLPELDWRTGFPVEEPDLSECVSRIKQFTQLIYNRNKLCIYIDTPIPPVFSQLDHQNTIQRRLKQSILELCDLVYDSDMFNLGSYLESGVPLKGNACGQIAYDLIRKLTEQARPACKVLISDLDNVVWQGVIGEDGYEGLQFSSSGSGYAHFIYQTYLKKLKNSGILIAAVSRNDPDLASCPFLKNEMVLKVDDFVAIKASYHSKSSQIKQLSEQLNLNTADFVFVDDNRLEIEEVKQAIPGIKTILFPESSEEINDFYFELSNNFNIGQVTQEDLDRTVLYKNRLASLPPSEAQGSDLTQFLKSLEMKITINNRSLCDNERALQLFNKTNQFNINGIRLDRKTLDQKLSSGYTLYTASNSDRYGDHGEVLACLLDQNKNIELLVMSCRVFQRRIEHFFIKWLSIQLDKEKQPILNLWYQKTERNTPVQHFLKENGVNLIDEPTQINIEKFLIHHSELDELFELQVVD